LTFFIARCLGGSFFARHSVYFVEQLLVVQLMALAVGCTISAARI